MKKLTASALTLLTLLTLAATGCTIARSLKGGKAFTGRTPSGGFSQVLLQGENPSVPSRQAQETIKTRTYSVPNTPALQYSTTPVLLAPALQYSTTPALLAPSLQYSTTPAL